jgi:hypothetical protein
LEGGGRGYMVVVWNIKFTGFDDELSIFDAQVWKDTTSKILQIIYYWQDITSNLLLVIYIYTNILLVIYYIITSNILIY